MCRPTHALKSVSVSVIPNAKPVLLKKSASVVVGGTLQLWASINLSGAEQKISWQVVKRTAVLVNTTGQVTAPAKGTAGVCAYVPNGKYATCVVTVVVPVRGIALSQKEAVHIVGKSAQLQRRSPWRTLLHKGVV